MHQEEIRLLGDYKVYLNKLIGKGGFSRVYEARQGESTKLAAKIMEISLNE